MEPRVILFPFYDISEHDTAVAGNEVENVGDLVKTEDKSLAPKFYPIHQCPRLSQPRGT